MNKKYNPILRVHAILDGEYIPETLQQYIERIAPDSDVNVRRVLRLKGQKVIIKQTGDMFKSIAACAKWLSQFSRGMDESQVSIKLCNMKRVGKPLSLFGYDLVYVTP